MHGFAMGPSTVAALSSSSASASAQRTSDPRVGPVLFIPQYYCLVRIIMAATVDDDAAQYNVCVYTAFKGVVIARHSARTF